MRSFQIYDESFGIILIIWKQSGIFQKVRFENILNISQSITKGRRFYAEGKEKEVKQLSKDNY